MARKRKSKDLFPKRIGGVKVPKKVRQGRFGELLASPSGQALLAQAVVGAGAIAAGLKAKDSPKVRHMAHKAKHALTDAGGEAKDHAADLTAAAGGMGGNLAYALGEAARTFAEAIQRGETRSFARAEDDSPDWTATYRAADAGAEPKQKQGKALEGETRSPS